SPPPRCTFPYTTLFRSRSDGPVYYGYKVTAGNAGDKIPNTDTTKTFTWPTPSEPWYLIEAKGDVDGNGTFSWAVGSSFTGEVYRSEEQTSELQSRVDRV